MTVTRLEIPDVLIIEPKRFGDDRGFFSETYSRPAFAEHGITCEFVQDNQSLSEHAGTVRGLHFQKPPAAQDKLVRCIRGAILDVAVDIRKGSPTYGQKVMAELSAENWKQIFVPKGFAHGFATLVPGTEVCYKVSAPYAPDSEGGIRFDDPDLAIDWHVDPESATLSEKDKHYPSLAEFESPFK